MSSLEGRVVAVAGAACGLGPTQVGFQLPPTGRLLILSPHLDDAALSCAALLERSEPVDILNVFAGKPEPPITTPWVRSTGFRDSTSSMNARLAEDQRAFAGSPHRTKYLDLLDADFGERSDDDARALTVEIEKWMSRADVGTIALPAGAGASRGWGLLRGRLPSHVDHVFVREQALRTIRHEFNVLLYDEIPYAVGVRDSERLRRCPALRAAEAIDVKIDRVAKAARVAAYVSQVPHMGRSRLDDPANLPPTERYWLLSAQPGFSRTAR